MVARDDGPPGRVGERRVERRVAGVEAQHRGLRELRGRGDDHDRRASDAAYDVGAELLVAATEHESLGADRAQDEMGMLAAIEQLEELSLVGVARHDPAVLHAVGPRSQSAPASA